MRLVCFVPVGMFCGSVDDGAGELSTSGEKTSLPCEKSGIISDTLICFNVCYFGI